jgi:hypothetical protein
MLEASRECMNTWNLIVIKGPIAPYKHIAAIFVTRHLHWAHWSFDYQNIETYTLSEIEYFNQIDIRINKRCTIALSMPE